MQQRHDRSPPETMLVLQLREESFFRRQFGLLELLERVHVLVGVNPFLEHERLVAKVPDGVYEVGSATRIEIVDECLQTCGEEQHTI